MKPPIFRKPEKLLKMSLNRLKSFAKIRLVKSKNKVD